MTIQQFQEANSLWLQSILNDPKGQALVSVLAANQPPHASNPNPHLFAKEAGKREGFENCIKLIHALSFVPKAQTDVEATYGVQEEKAE